MVWASLEDVLELGHIGVVVPGGAMPLGCEVVLPRRWLVRAAARSADGQD
jgi:hypothetical protein